jgi:hypothetical protein
VRRAERASERAPAERVDETIYILLSAFKSQLQPLRNINTRLEAHTCVCVI